MNRHKHIYNLLFDKIKTSGLPVYQTFNESYNTGIYIYLSEERSEDTLTEGQKIKQRVCVKDIQIYIIVKDVKDLRNEGILRDKTFSFLEDVENTLLVTSYSTYTHKEKGSNLYEMVIDYISINSNNPVIDVEQGEAIVLIEGEIKYLLNYL